MNTYTYSDELRFRIKWILSDRVYESSVMLALAAFVLSIGFFIAHGTNHNYEMIQKFGDFRFWAILFFSYSLIKVITSITNAPAIISTANSIVGVWAWNYIFLSFVVFDTTPVTPTELMLALPIMLEFWVMIHTPNKDR